MKRLSAKVGVVSLSRSLGRAQLLASVAALAVCASIPAVRSQAAESTGDISEIVVTANKSDAQKVIDVPASIQAIDGNALQKAGISNFIDVAGEIPGLSVQDLGPGDKKYVIRGVNSTGDSTTGVYYDEAVISGSNANDGGGFESDIKLIDLNHVEVLRGPQGTLYGASSMSGTIKFVTNKPDLNNFGGYVTGETSNTSHGSENYDANGVLNLPIVDGMLALRAAGWKVEDSGFINQIRVGQIGLLKGVNNDDAEGGRVSLRFQPIESLTIDASVTQQSESSRGSSRYTPAGVTSWGAPGTPGLAPVQGCDLCNTDVTQSPWKDELTIYSLTVDYAMSNGTITATTNQYNRKLDFQFDSTPVLIANGVPIAGQTLEPQRRDVNSSEIRYASKFDGPVNFVVGGFRQHETNDLVVNVLTTNGLGLPSGPFSSSNSADALSNPGVGDTFFGRFDNRTTTQYAGFGEVTWKVTPKLTVVGGVRYFTEDLEGNQEQTHPFGGFPPGQPVGVLIPDPSQSYNKITTKGNISYEFADWLLAYATASQGFRGGGLNARSLPFEPIPDSFAPDSLWNYEAGAKGRLFDGKLDYQVDAYQIRWYNMQAQETTADGAFNFTGNAGNAKINGVEFEFSGRLWDHLSGSVAGSYQDAYLVRGVSPAVYAANPTLGRTGEKIPNVAPFQFNLGLNYTAPLASDWNYTVAGDLSYRGSENAYFVSNPYNIKLNSYELLNMRASVTNGVWRATVFARNVTDERAQVSAINSQQDPDALLTVRPRTVGVSVTRNF